MINITKILLLLFTNMLIFQTLISASSIVQVQKKNQGGSDPCGAISCLDLGSPVYLPEVPFNTLEVEITINQTDPSSQFSFPWQVRVESPSGRFLGESMLFDRHSFSLLPHNTGLRKATVVVNLNPLAIRRVISRENIANSVGCLTDQCGNDYSNTDLVFSIYSETSKVDMSCLSFLSPDLSPGTNMESAIFRTCDCVNPNEFLQLENLPQKSIESLEFVEKMNNSHVNESNQAKKSTFFDAKPIKVFPNPAKEVLKIQILPESTSLAMLTLRDINGVLWKRQMIQKDERGVDLDLSEFPPGFYIITYTVGAAAHAEKVLIIR